MRSLHDDHIADLRRSGLDNSTIAMMGVCSVVPQNVPGFESGLYARVDSVLEIPYPAVENFSRYRLFPPIETQSGTMKYFQPPETGNHLYVLPPVQEIINDIAQPLTFVEGEKKAARAVQAGMKSIGFSGIWNWKEKEIWSGINDLRAIPFTDRPVTIVPDSDTWMRDDLQRAVYAFARYLESRGAKVLVAILPQRGTEKVGLDDYFLDHSLDDLMHEKWIPTRHPTLKQHKEWYEDWKSKKTNAASSVSSKCFSKTMNLIPKRSTAPSYST